MLTRLWSYCRPIKFDRYILTETIGTFFGSCMFILFILIMFQALRLAEIFIIHGVSAYLLAKLTFYLSLSFLPAALPLAFLTSVLVGFGRLSADSELIALKSCGMSISRLATPIVFFAIVIVGLSLLLNIRWVPWGEMEFKKTQIKITNTKAVTAVKEGTFTSNFFDLLIFADKVDIPRNRLYRVFIHDEREAKNPMTYVAREAEILPVKTSSDLSSAIMLKLYNGSSHHNNLETKTYEKMDFDVYNLYLKVTEGHDSLVEKPHMIPQNDLIQRIKRTTLETYEGREYRGEYWRRFSTALSPLTFVLLGIGFGSFRSRSTRSSAFISGFVILLIYWTLQTIGTGALLKGSMSPFTAMQVPNLVMLIIGIFSFKKAAW